jgi:hypothetical protein
MTRREGCSRAGNPDSRSGIQVWNPGLESRSGIQVWNPDSATTRTPPRREHLRAELDAWREQALQKKQRRGFASALLWSRESAARQMSVGGSVEPLPPIVVGVAPLGLGVPIGLLALPPALAAEDPPLLASGVLLMFVFVPLSPLLTP